MTYYPQPPWDASNPVAPFDSAGDLVDWPARYREYDWRPVEPFPAVMRLVGSSRGRSSATFEWEDDKGQTWPMFMTDMVDLIRRGEISEGTATGVWTVRKRGTNYGLALAPEAGS